VYICLHVKQPLFSSEFNETWEFSRKIFDESSNIKFHENPIIKNCKKILDQFSAYLWEIATWLPAADNRVVTSLKDSRPSLGTKLASYSMGTASISPGLKRTGG